MQYVDYVNNMKQCKTCGEHKPLDQFQSSGWSTRKSDGVRRKNYKSSCSICHNAKDRAQYHDQFDDLVSVWKCYCCGYDKCRSAMDFHHIDPNDKKFQIRGVSRKKINREEMLAEIAKCVLVCCRCHREIHDDIRNICEQHDLDSTKFKFTPLPDKA